MEKGDALKYLVVALVFVGLASILFVLRPAPTGYVIYSPEMNESECNESGYVWEDVVVGEDCSNVTIGVCDQDCTNETIECEPCLDDPLPANESDCVLWSSCDEETCVDVNCTNVTSEECVDVTEKQCICAIKTCVDYSGQCGSSLDDNCGSTIDCSGNCDSGYECSDGTCVVIEEDEDEDEEESSVEDVEGTSVPFVKGLLVGDINVDAGGIVTSLLNVKNIGQVKLLNCKLKVEGDVSSWISSNVISNLESIEDVNFTFTVDVPETIAKGTYVVDLSIECGTAELNDHSQPVNIIVSEKAPITGEVVSEQEEAGGLAGITGLAIFEGTAGKVTAYVVFLLVLAAAVFLVWRRHGQIAWLAPLEMRIKGLFNK